MKINRLLELTMILLNKGTVTAKDMATRFGVSTRTIYRDIDELSSSGIPIYCNRGSGGGISLIEDYSINRTILSNSEREKILFALQSLKITNYPGVEDVLMKLGAIFKDNTKEWIKMDHQPWGSDPNQQDKFTEIKKAILEERAITFDYISRDNIRNERTIYPLRLTYKGSGWYLSGFCMKRKAMRLFRLSRMKSVKITTTSFQRSDYEEILQNEVVDFEYNNIQKEAVRLRFTSEALYRLYDEYDDDMIIKNEDGTFSIELNFEQDDWLCGYILSFGNSVYVEGPDELKEKIMINIEQMYRKYF